MDEATFQKELTKYKVVRKIDHYKIRFNKKVGMFNISTKMALSSNFSWIYRIRLQKDVKKIADRSVPAVSPVIKKEHAQSSNAKFWDIVQGAPRTGLTSAEWGKFMSAMKTVRR